jgi:hypothetical protein
MDAELTQEELARITDTAHKIQSAERALTPIDSRKIPGLDEIRLCLQNADKTLRASSDLSGIELEGLKSNPS